jgi:hypothetical protein
MNFIIWTPPFSDGLGGVIALHLLCHRLNGIGETALLWPAGRPAFNRRFIARDLLRAGRWALGGPRRPWRDPTPFRNPVARRADLPGSVVVYPEMVPGNPLGEPRVVRWLLHKPGFHTGNVDYSPTDLCFHYQDAFDDLSTSCRRGGRLTLTWWNQLYKDKGSRNRSGSAYLVRKGKGHPFIHDLSRSVCVDEMSHEEKADVFNSVEYFYSYDLHTMYSLYAAICGCTPIVVRDPAVPKEKWLPNIEDRYGVAYGEDEIDWAIATRPKLLEKLEGQREAEDRMLREFVRRCREACA